MKVTFNTSLSFQRRLKENEKADFAATLSQGKQTCGNTGKSVLIVPSISLPQNLNNNTGVGNLTTKEGREFFDFAKQYWGINTVQLLTEGQIKNTEKGQFKPYSGSSLDLGEHLINMELLTTNEYANLLTKEDFAEIAAANKDASKDTRINFENVLQKKCSTKQKLKKAFNELLKADTPQKRKMLDEIKDFDAKNSEWLEKKALFAAIRKHYSTDKIKVWTHIDRHLLDPEYISVEMRDKRIKELIETQGFEYKFYKFKQYLANKNLKTAKDTLNSNGIKLSGDMPYGFSFDEIWAYPKAFHRLFSVGFGIRAMNFDEKEAEELLRLKTRLYGERFDELRVDMAWAYSNQPLYSNSGDFLETRKNYKDKFLEIIEEEFKKIKGDKFKKTDIAYEFISSLEDFDIYEGARLKPFVEDKIKIYCSNGMHDNWGTVDNFKKRGWRDDGFILGTTNHDCKSMKIQYAQSADREVQASVLSKILKIPKEKISDTKEFIKAKFAEPMRAKNNMIFYLDSLALDGLYQHNINAADDYRIKIPEGYQEHYFKALENGEGFNVMDALEKAFVSKGLDKKNPELFDKIVKYRKILQQPESKSHNNKTKWIIGGAALVAATAGVIIYKSRCNNSTAAQEN